VNSVLAVHSVWWCPPKSLFHQSNRIARLTDPVYLHPCGYRLLRITRTTELSYAKVLKAHGHDVKEAHDGKQGVDMVAVEKFDLILMDISRPVLNGRRATCQIRQSNGASSRARIVSPIANAMPSEQDDFLKRGMDDILTKPLEKSDLLIAFGAKEHTPLPGGYVLGGPCPYGRNLSSSRRIELSKTVGRLSC
jgi:CheY-like chemotaxis protein